MKKARPYCIIVGCLSFLLLIGIPQAFWEYHQTGDKEAFDLQSKEYYRVVEASKNGTRKPIRIHLSRREYLEAVEEGQKIQSK